MFNLGFGGGTDSQSRDGWFSVVEITTTTVNHTIKRKTSLLSQ